VKAMKETRGRSLRDAGITVTGTSIHSMGTTETLAIAQGAS